MIAVVLTLPLLAGMFGMLTGGPHELPPRGWRPGLGAPGQFWGGWGVFKGGRGPLGLGRLLGAGGRVGVLPGVALLQILAVLTVLAMGRRVGRSQ